MFPSSLGEGFKGTYSDSDIGGINTSSAPKSCIRRLVDDLRVPLHPELLRRIKIIDAHDWASVRRKTRELYRIERGVVLADVQLNELIYGLKQYYAVALVDPLNNHAVSAQIDVAWHAHMLHSEQYTRFSDEVVGRYIHHTPLDDDDACQVEDVRRLYNYTLEVLPKLFCTVSEKLWPNENSPAFLKLICFHQKDYEDVNQYALFGEDPRASMSVS